MNSGRLTKGAEIRRFIRSLFAARSAAIAAAFLLLALVGIAVMLQASASRFQSSICFRLFLRDGGWAGVSPASSPS